MKYYYPCAVAINLSVAGWNLNYVVDGSNYWNLFSVIISLLSTTLVAWWWFSSSNAYKLNNNTLKALKILVFSDNVEWENHHFTCSFCHENIKLRRIFWRKWEHKACEPCDQYEAFQSASIDRS